MEFKENINKPNSIVYNGVTWVKSKLVEDLEKRVEELESKLYELETLAIDETTQKIKVDVEIEEQQKVDFSILNDTDVFWCELFGGQIWMFRGKDTFRKTGKSTLLRIDKQDKYKYTWLCEIIDVKQLRKATPEECELFYKHFPEERPKEEKLKVWIEVFRRIEGNALRYGTRYSSDTCREVGYKTPDWELIDIIEFEY